jgi:hypothetical protein
MIPLDRHPAPRILRNFALSLLAVGLVFLLLLGAWGGRWVAASVAAGVCALGGLAVLALPREPARLVYLGYSIPGWLLGNVVSRVILALFFYGLITPIGLVMRLAGRDPLDVKGRAPSPWHELPEDTRTPADWERPF